MIFPYHLNQSRFTNLFVRLLLFFSLALCPRTMLNVHKSYFAVLNGEEGDIDTKFTNPTPNKAKTPLPWKNRTKKNQQEAKWTPDQMRAKPLVLPGHANNLGVPAPAAARALQSPFNNGCNYNHRNKWSNNGGFFRENRLANGSDENENLEKEQEENPSVLTLKEYEKQLLQKKASSNLLNMSVAEQQRIVDVSEDFKSMKLVGKKKAEKETGEKEKTVSKNGSVNEKKVGKSMSFDGFFEPVRRQMSFANNNCNQFQVVKEDKVKADTVLRFEDAKQFPSLGATI